MLGVEPFEWKRNLANAVRQEDVTEIIGPNRVRYFASSLIACFVAEGFSEHISDSQRLRQALSPCPSSTLSYCCLILALLCF